MKIIGLNITKGRVAVTIIEKSLRQTELKDSFVQSFATDAELVEVLKEKTKDWAGGRIVSSIPGHLFSQRAARFPFGDRKHVEKALPFEIEDSVPFDLNDVVLDHLVVDKTDKSEDKKSEFTVLGMMLPKTVLRQHLELLATAGVDAQMVVPSYVGLYFVSKMVPTEGGAVLIDGQDLCIKNDKTIAACRSFSGSRSTGGISHILKGFESAQGVKIEKAFLLSESEAVRAELAELGIAVDLITPEYGGKKATDPVGLGLALSEEVNFRKGDFAYRLADVGARRRRRTLIIAGAAAAMLMATNLGLKVYLTESTYGKLDREIKDLFRQAAPDSKLVGDPVEQLKRKLDESRKKFGVLGTGASALGIMKTVTEGIPKEVRVGFQEFLLEGDRLKLQGEASSFEAVDKIKAELLKAAQIAEVTVQDTRMGVDNKVKFRFDIKLKQTL